MPTRRRNKYSVSSKSKGTTSLEEDTPAFRNPINERSAGVHRLLQRRRVPRKRYLLTAESLQVQAGALAVIGGLLECQPRLMGPRLTRADVTVAMAKCVTGDTATVAIGPYWLRSYCI